VRGESSTRASTVTGRGACGEQEKKASKGRLCGRPDIRAPQFFHRHDRAPAELLCQMVVQSEAELSAMTS
jgi:hypothetical protein